MTIICDVALERARQTIVAALVRIPVLTAANVSHGTPIDGIGLASGIVAHIADINAMRPCVVTALATDTDLPSGPVLDLIPSVLDPVVPVGIHSVDGVIACIRVPVCAHAWLCDLEPVWLEEQAECGVVVAGVEVLQAGVAVEAFADEAFGVGRDKDGGDLFGGGGTEGKEGLLSCDGPCRVGDQHHRVQLVAVQVAFYSVHKPHVGMRVGNEGQPLLINCKTFCSR